MSENKNTNISIKDAKKDSPTPWRVIVREFAKDKIALGSLILMAALLLFIFITAYPLDAGEVTSVDIFKRFIEPGQDGYLLGTDDSGRDVFHLLVMGARNSLIIDFLITIICMTIGVVVGIVAAYYGGIVDNIIMRILEFLQIIPQLLFIIVYVTLIKKYTIYHFIFIMSVFGWIGIARLVRAKALSEARRDYVSASKTLGTGDFKIMFREILPNVATIIIVSGTLGFAGNMGIETGLAFLGFGFPPTMPSLGTLISYANDTTVLRFHMNIWLPAAILILIMMLCINYIGQALKRASDAKQRLG